STGYRILVNGAWYVLGGTSAVAPLIASLYALLSAGVAAAHPGQRAGDFLSLLYGTLAPAGAVHDITTGSNGQYTATPGPDAVTGVVGERRVRLEVADLAGQRPHIALRHVRRVDREHVDGTAQRAGQRREHVSGAEAHVVDAEAARVVAAERRRVLGDVDT